MQESAIGPDPGFVVDWQLADDADQVIDLTTAESDVILPDDATIRASLGINPRS
jgi:hypothetical protein